MSASKYELVVQAIHTVTADVSFRDRWVSVNSMVKAIQCRYHFEQTLSVTSSMLSRSLQKIDPMIDILGTHHQSGLYMGIIGKERFIYVQDSAKVPPLFPPVRGSSELWDRIRMKDASETDNYILRVDMVRNRARGTKRSKSDDLDIRIKNDLLEYKSVETALSREFKNDSMFSYWKSPEALKLFNPNNGENVMECLARRDTLLWRASVDDDVLCTLIDEIDSIDELTVRQASDIRKKCMYLRKAYEYAIQKMNKVSLIHLTYFWNSLYS